MIYGEPASGRALPRRRGPRPLQPAGSAVGVFQHLGQPGADGGDPAGVGEFLARGGDHIEGVDRPLAVVVDMGRLDREFRLRQRLGQGVQQARAVAAGDLDHLASAEASLSTPTVGVMAKAAVRPRSAPRRARARPAGRARRLQRPASRSSARGLSQPKGAPDASCTKKTSSAWPSPRCRPGADHIGRRSRRRPGTGRRTGRAGRWPRR